MKDAAGGIGDNGFGVNGGVGSVISSFDMYDLHSGIYRDSDYVYVVYYCYNSPLTSLDKSTATGSPCGPVCHLSRRWYGDADHSPLGDGYFSLTASGTPDVIHDRESATGSIVGSWSPLDDISACAYVPGSQYRYVGDGKRVLRFTTSGGFVSSFSANFTSLAATNFFCGKEGEYVVAAGRPSIAVYDGNGSFIRNFAAPRDWTNYGAVCGPGYPEDCGITCWCIYDKWVQPYNEPYVFQISLGNGIAVEPASVGKVKALFR